ncbi:hypothetical protein MRB53_040015 [Persea americana]|nr:hypothetical protein MRB53_040015 [Persea americana]
MICWTRKVMMIRSRQDQLSRDASDHTSFVNHTFDLCQKKRSPKDLLQLSKKEIAKLKEQEAADARNAKAIGTNKDGAVELQKVEDKQQNHADGGIEVATIKQPERQARAVSRSRTIRCH